MSDTIRTFLAFPIPETIIRHIEAIQLELKTRGFRFNWVRPGNIHLTLKFFGNIFPSDVEKIISVVGRSTKNAVAPKLLAGGIGVFPGIKRPRVLWAGLSGDTNAVMEIQKILAADLDAAGFPSDGKPFKAHLTIARIKHKVVPRDITRMISEFGKKKTKPFAADRIVLYKSILKKSGAEYQELWSTTLVDPERTHGN